MGLKLYFLKENKTDCEKIRIAASYFGVDLELVQDSHIPSSVTSHMKTHPICEFPVLETPDGFISRSDAIMRYVAQLARNLLDNCDFYKFALIEQWIDFSSSRMLPNIKESLLPEIGCCAAHFFSAVGPENTTLKTDLGVLDKHLASNTYVVGDSVTLADIVVTCDLCLGFTQLMPPSFTSKFPHVEAYFWTLVNQPNFKKILGEVKQIECLQYGNMAQTMYRMIAAPFAPPTASRLSAQPQ